MISKSKHMEYIDKYLSHELTGEELREANAELFGNPEFEEDIELLQDIEQAIQEKDIMALRANLESITTSEKDNFAVNTELYEEVVMQSYEFELSENLSSFNEFKEPVTNNDLKAFAESLPVLHLAQHKIAEKENIHQFYKEQGRAGVNSDEELELTPQDEAIFNEIEDALSEKDVFDLRDNLKQIAASVPVHERTSAEIEQFIDQDFDEDLLIGFEEELQFNIGLEKDVILYKEINTAVSEIDVMNLRDALEDIQNTEASTSQKIEEIEQYISNELNDEELILFETELSNNPDLAAELNLHMDLESAIQESDIIDLRAKLGVISKDIIKEKEKERSFFTRIPRARVAIGTIAASLILFISVSGLINKNSSEDELYSQYFSPYQSAGVFRSGDVDVDSKVNEALDEFNAENYNSALVIFNEILVNDQDNPVGNFYSGMAYQEIDQYDKAITSYQKVVELSNNLFVEQAEWYTGLCYLQTEEKQKAYGKFKKIAESDGYYSEKAVAILRKMKYLE